jgi:cell division protease FtsH
MKFSLAAVTALLLTDQVVGFAPHTPLNAQRAQNKARFMSMAVDMPPAPESNNNLPVVQQNSYGQPADVRYSDFLKLVNADRIEKCTFSADGTQLLGVDVDGVRLKIESLPNDPDLLTQLTNHKVDVTVLPQQEASGLGELAQSLIFPAALFAGLFFLSRRGGGAGMPGGMGGPGGPMGFGKSKAQ